MELSIFTINIWGLKFVSNRCKRVAALADSLINNGYDVVCMQELWCNDDFKYLKQFCGQVYKYIHYFHSGLLGSGMCIMSRYPIIDVHYHPFLLNGYVHMFWHGDWFGGKGIGLCRINVKGIIVDVYTTHLHACYNSSNDKYLKHRVMQAFETANFIRISSAGSDLTILAGDLNSEPNDICYKLISSGANLKDCYMMCSSNRIVYTFNHPRNSYKNLKEDKSRLDYILYKFNNGISVNVKEHRYSLPSRVPGQNYSYSDHEPIEAVFEISVVDVNLDKKIKVDNNLQYKTILDNISQNICNEHLVTNPLISNWYFIFLLLLIIIFYNVLLPHSYYIIFILMLIFTVIFIYSFSITYIERNCVHSFSHQIETLFCD